MNGSLAAAHLGIQRTDDTDPASLDGVIDGSAIGGVRLSDRFFIENALVSADFDLTTPTGVSAGAKFGFVGIDLSGDANLHGGISLGLQDPGTVALDGRITLTELFQNLDNFDALIQPPATIGSGSFVFDVALDPAIPGIDLGANPRVEINLLDIGNPFAGEAPDFSFSFPDLGELVAFDNLDFDFSAILDGLIALSEFLGEFESFGFLDEPIPLINVSVNDLLSYADRLDAAIEAARNNPAGTLQFLEDKLKEAFGIPSNSNLIGLSLVRDDGGTPGNTSDDLDILRVDLRVDESFSESLSVDFAVPGFGDNLAAAAGLQASGALTIDLAFGFDLASPTSIYIFDDTSITGSLTAAGNDLSFVAALGGFGLTIQDGTASIGAAFSAGLDPTIFTAGRVLLSDVQFGSDVDINFSGTVDAALPVYFPNESNYRGDITLSGDLTDPSSFSVVVPPDLFTLNPSDFSLLDNVLLIVDGIDLFLEGLQDVLDGEVFSVPLPLVGDKLADGARFIEDFREGFIEDSAPRSRTAATRTRTSSRASCSSCWALAGWASCSSRTAAGLRPASQTSGWPPTSTRPARRRTSSSWAGISSSASRSTSSMPASASTWACPPSGSRPKATSTST
ncbi:MAG: hypothetical protein IPG57_23830 [Burkholderiales bacterium]|nr:hypothetical protein [Burkholderiales bacterium]